MITIAACLAAGAAWSPTETRGGNSWTSNLRILDGLEPPSSSIVVLCDSPDFALYPQESRGEATWRAWRGTAAHEVVHRRPPSTR